MCPVPPLKFRDRKFKKKYIVSIYFLLFCQFIIAQSPIANLDNYSTEINTSLIIDASLGVLSNDDDGDPSTDLALTLISFSIVGKNFLAGDTASFTGGQITLNANGSFIFNPTTNYTGNTSMILYTISNGASSTSANLNINVNSRPEANNDYYTGETNTPLSITGVLNNDRDFDGDPITVTNFSIVGVNCAAGETASFVEGSITLNTNGSFIFNPIAAFTGNTSTITYTISDGVLTDSADLDIRVNTTPDAQDDYDTVEINTSLNIDVLGNDTDSPANDPSALSVIGFNINGTDFSVGETANLAEGDLTLNADGSFTFNPTSGYTGNVPVITYTISDGIFEDSADLFLTVENITNLLEIVSLSSCNQGYTASGEYKIQYSTRLRNTSTARDFHPANLIGNINLTTDLDVIYGNDCVIRIDNVSISMTNEFEFTTQSNYPQDFNASAINPGFLDATSNAIFNTTATNDFILYPRQAIDIQFCVVVNPLCNGRLGTSIDFNNTLNVTSNTGNSSASVSLIDFHITETTVAAGLFIPDITPPLKPDGTYEYTNTVIITNEGAFSATNINYNMGLSSFLDNGIAFSQLTITQTSGPAVSVNTSYNGDTNTNLLTLGNSLAAGETITLEVFYLTTPTSSASSHSFAQSVLSQTQGIADGFDESTPANQRQYSFITWTDTKGNHLDRYYALNSSNEAASSESQCICSNSNMTFETSISSISNQKIISNISEAPNGILEHQEITFEITSINSSNLLQLENLELQDDLRNICNGNIISVGATSILGSSTASINPTLNINFNGTTDSNIFDGTSGLLQPNQFITVQFTVLLSEDCIGTNSANFSASDPFGGSISLAADVSVDASTDTDNDGITNFNDLDDDNDTILDVDEYNNDPTLIPLDDHDSDFTPNYRDLDFGIDANSDGIVDVFDFDNDGVPNHFDLDSDNDGILDIVEVGNTALDTDNSGTTNNSVGANGLDNAVETNDTFTASIIYTIPNTDGDQLNNPDFLDIDADGDGIVDQIEAQTTASYIAQSGTVTASGIDTAYPNGNSPIDTDGDSSPDYLDLNSDNDFRIDAIEGWDFDSNGIPETLASALDSDNDGLNDGYDSNNTLSNPTNNQNPTSFPNADNTDTDEKDWREIIAIFVLIENVSATEGATLIFEIKLVTKNDNTILIQSTTDIDIDFSTSDGTNPPGGVYNIAASPHDYNGITASINLRIPAFTETGQFSVISLEDIIDELDELFTLNGSVTSNNTLNTEVFGIGTIQDNDAMPTIEMNDSVADEGDDLVHIIHMTRPSSRPTEIEVTTIDNVAISPDDYTPISDTFTIPGRTIPDLTNPEPAVFFNISTLEDNLNELDQEILNVTGRVTSANTLNSSITQTGTILDIDPDPLVVIEDNTVVEGSALVFKISLLNANLALMQNYLPINLELKSVSETASVVQDFQLLSISTAIPAFTSTITQTLETINDKLNEDTETMFLEANITSVGVSNSPPVASAIGTIKDDDFPNLFSPNLDGKSDFFKIDGIEDFPNFIIVIFDRWGSEVFNYKNNGNPTPKWWDGNYKGKPVIEGVYYYTLDFNDGSTPPQTNFIQLVR
jgi:gliding motility-associated-like protein